jgi:hypothetical protein
MLAAIAEIGRCAPELVAPFVGPMTAYLWDEGLRPGILKALRRIAEVAPELVADESDRLKAIEDLDDPGERADLERLLAVNRESVNGE